MSGDSSVGVLACRFPGAVGANFQPPIHRVRHVSADCAKGTGTCPTRATLDDALEAMGGFDPDERYPEYGHDSLREAYRIGYEDAEQAVRANVAAEIRAARTQVPTGDVAGQFEAAALGLAATIVEGKHP